MHKVDYRGYKCPIPVLKAQKLLNSLQVGEICSFSADDTGAKADFHALCKHRGYEIIKEKTENKGDDDEFYVVLIKKL